MITKLLPGKLKKDKPLLVILLGLILFSFLLSPGQVRADAAPLKLPGGAALDPGDAATQVRMVAETVTLEVAPPNPEMMIEAWVTADFTLRNLGDTPERILVGFPLTCFECISSESGDSEEINDLTVYVNTLQVATREETLTFPSYQDTLSINWAVFEVTFPPGQDVLIRVTYTAGGWGEISNSYRTFSYVLVTGAGWYDSIGSADIIARLPYPANELNTWFDRSGLTGDSATLSPTISGNELRWHLEDFEPAQDFALTIVHPWQWYSALVEEENVRLNPQDGEAWGRLGRIYKQMLDDHNSIRMDSVAEEIYARAVEAYEHATTLLPGDAMWHAGFAELLFNHFYWVDYIGNWDRPADDLSALSRAVDEVRRSLEIDPDNELALDILDWVIFTFPDAIQIVAGKVDYPILTSTAGFTYTFRQATATPLPTSTPRPTATPGVAATSTAAPIPGDTGSVAPGNQTPAPPSTTAEQISPQAAANPTAQTSDISPLWIAGILLVIMVGLSWLLRRKHA
jgi:tetratricopeptide (TPR) repeat protein